MVDLHLHLDGSLRPATVMELLNKEGLTSFATEEEAKKALTVSRDCRDLNEYLEKFEYPIKVLQTEENIKRAVYELGLDLSEQGIDYAEIRFAPQFSMEKGLTMEQVVEAAIDGARMAEGECDNLRLGLILCCMRGASKELNIMTVEVAAKYIGDHVCAIDLAGAEGLYPTDLYEDIFELAEANNIPFTIHAGEAAGPESIWRALEMGAKRIGHGIHCIEDSVLVDYLARHKITLELCPTSNLQTKACTDIEKYPIKELLMNDVHVTINTDNMTVSGTTLKDEYKLIKKYCDVTDEDIELMENYSREGAFLSDNTRE